MLANLHVITHSGPKHDSSFDLVELYLRDVCLKLNSTVSARVFEKVAVIILTAVEGVSWRPNSSDAYPTACCNHNVFGSVF